MTIEETLRDLGLKMESTLLRDDFNGRKGDSHWQVTLVCNGQAFSTEYHMGCAHRYHTTPLGKRSSKEFVVKHGRMTVHDLERYKRSKPENPNLADVMHSLVSDAQCVAHGQTFEQFAEEMGYDVDSRQAEGVFNGCREEYFALQRLGLDLDELSELFQDY